MTLKVLTAALLAGLVATAAHAEKSAKLPVKKGAQAAAEAAPDDIICTYETSVGSHIKRRVCASRADREQRAASDQKRINDMRRGSGRANTERSLN